VIPRFALYLFDLDGTLVDSAADICGAIQDTLASTRRTDLSDEFLRGYIGRHLLELFADVLPEYSPEQIDRLIVDYRRIYPARGHAMTRVYPGVREALAALEGRKSTATIKATHTTRLVLEQFGLLQFFDHVQGTDGFPAKPEPDVIHASLKVFGVPPEECLMVGDSPADMEAGRRAGVRICAVRYGYGKAGDLARYQPDYWIDDPRELLRIEQRGIVTAVPGTGRGETVE
jgi:HAD superfamily hydrolase (TIGR01509 family)